MRLDRNAMWFRVGWTDSVISHPSEETVVLDTVSEIASEDMPTFAFGFSHARHGKQETQHGNI
jgi:hypothetical protein